MVILGGCCLMIRASGLMNLPIFGDEAIYLRWAQLIRGEGVGSMHLWVSLADPKPPLHYWLLALFFHGLGGNTDPLAAGRWIERLDGRLLHTSDLSGLLRMRAFDSQFGQGKGSQRAASSG